MRIQLLYFDDCPGHAELRDRLPLLLDKHWPLFLAERADEVGTKLKPLGLDGV